MGQRLIGYIRVSRVAGREGDSFISPSDQRERIHQLAVAHGHTILDWQTDLDQPGSTMNRPAFEAAMQAVERGDAEGIAVAKLDRFARSVSGAGSALERLEAAGGSLVAVDLGMDTSTPSGRLMRNVLMALAEFELDRITENWLVTRRNAIARGVHISRVPPVGYVRGADGRLERDPVAAPVVREVFLRRAAGTPWRELCAFLDERLPKEKSWTRGTVANIIERRTYLGEAFQGDDVNPTAHEPLISRAEFEAAQRGSRPPVRNGTAPLQGLIRCAACGYVMTRRSDGRRGYSSYECNVRHGGGVCPEPAKLSTLRADGYVERAFLDWIEREPIAVEASDMTRNVERALARVETAEAELAAFRDANLITVIGRDAYVAGLVERKRVVEEARRELSEAQQAASSPLHRAHGLRETWPTLTIAERRTLLTAAIDAIFVRRAHLPGRAPVGDRIHICWRGEGPAELPGRELAELRPFVFPDEAPPKLGVAGAHHG
jgi:site-specific DNA recombinase